MRQRHQKGSSWALPMFGLGVLALSACSPSASPEGNAQLDVTIPGMEGHVSISGGNSALPTPFPSQDPISVSLDDQGYVEVVTLDDTLVVGRGRQRMDLDQLDAAMRQVTNGLTWTEVSSTGVETELFKSLSLTLGKPDFIQITDEDRSVSLLFEKFLADAANNVCRKLVDKEVTQSQDQRILMTDVEPEDTIYDKPEAVEANLRHLLLRYHARYVLPGAPELDPWLWLFESGSHVGQSPTMGWRAVCVGLFTHPDFYSY